MIRDMRAVGALCIFVAALAPVVARAASKYPELICQFTGETSCTKPGKKCGGYGPLGGLSHLRDAIYGTTTGGGAYDSGTLFKIDVTNHTCRSVHDFNSSTVPDGAAPQAALTPVHGQSPATDMLYGTTSAGGSLPNSQFGFGTLFAYQPSTKLSTVLHTFAGAAAIDQSNGATPDGSTPLGPVIYDHGFLYGTTSTGGGNGCFDRDGCGTLFSYDLATKKYTILWAFQGTFSEEHPNDGSTPLGALLLYQGALYGTTSSGGGLGCFAAEGCGTVFQYVLATGAYKVLHRFCSDANVPPNSPGPGQFCLNDGASPVGGITALQSKSGGPTLLYGATAQGGQGDCNIGGCGTVYRLNPALIGTNVPPVKMIFNNFLPGTTGALPGGSLTPDTYHREVLGAALSGGTGNPGLNASLQAATPSGPCGSTPDIKGPAGTIYSLLLTDTPTLQAVLNFNGLAFGSYPTGALVIYNDPVTHKNDLYGETFLGGDCQSGTVFKINDIEQVLVAAGSAPSARSSQ